MSDTFIDANKVIYTVEKTTALFGLNVVIFTSSKNVNFSYSNKRRHLQDLYTFMLDKIIYKED